MRKQKQLTKKQKLRNKAKAYRERTKRYKNKFNTELRKAINTAIVAAFGFIIALSWREVITEYVNAISKISPLQGKLIEAIIITIISVIGILIVTSIFTKKD